MENISNLELEIKSINSIKNVLFIDYLKKSDNSILQERIELNEELYCNLYDTFLKDLPVFISDKLCKYLNPASSPAPPKTSAIIV